VLTKRTFRTEGITARPFVRCRVAGERAFDRPRANTSRRFFESKGWDRRCGIRPGRQHRLPEAVVLQRPLGRGMMGAAGVPGVLVSQACSTSAFAVYQAGMGVETGLFGNGWCLLADRCSNGPHASWPNPNGPGGQVISEDWVMDNFGKDPWRRRDDPDRGEREQESGVTRAECDEITLRRQGQYEASLADDRAFQKRYMFPSKCRSPGRRPSPSPRTRNLPSTKEGWRACVPSFRTACTRSERRPTRRTETAASA